MIPTPPRVRTDRRRVSLLARVVVAVVLGALGASSALLLPSLAVAQGVDGGGEASTTEGGADDAAVETPGAARLRALAGDINALAEGKLAADVSPQSLFDVPLDDEAAIGLEAARLEAILRQVDWRASAQRDASAKRSPGDAGDAAPALADVPPELWQARVEVDRARAAFYALPAARRSELVAQHAMRQSEAGAPTDAELRAKEAEAKRELALKAARDARSEAERLVSEEYARLLRIESDQADFEQKLAASKKKIADRREATLVWQRRARESRGSKSQSDIADAIYDDLRTALRSARDDLDRVLEELSTDASEVPRAGPDPLANLQTTVDTKTAREERARVEAAASRLANEERELHDEQLKQLIDEADTLNGERLAMLPYLSRDKRSSITGFTAAGLEQAAAEVRHLTLIARYHRYAATTWVDAIRKGRQGSRAGLGAAVFAVFELLVAVGFFLWVRRRTPAALLALRKRAHESDRHERLATPGLMSRAVAFAMQIQRPVEWLAFALLASWLLPSWAQSLLEVQLLTVVVEWVLGGALVVVVVNALAGAERGAPAVDHRAAELRLRSLRLVGRVVVAFGLVLVLTSRLVGPGTIYQWVLSTCWISSIPVFLVLVRWWREVVFQRAERSRKKTSFENWVLANRQGWKSFLAATGGGVYVFGRGIVRATRSWISRFTLTRSVLAYLFRRELDKLEAERADLVTARISNDAFDALGPERHSPSLVKTDAQEQIEGLQERLRERRGGVVALVGAFGMGKSTLLRRLHAEFPDTLLVDAPEDGEIALRNALAEPLGLAKEAPLEASAEALERSDVRRAILLDNAQRFVLPFMGGLDTFDALLAAASSHSSRTVWVLAIDEILWLFLSRARAGRPLFDEVVRLNPWREEQIIELLRTRTEAAGLDPSFERLLEKLPPKADEIDKLEALEGRAASYYRLLWDYAAGNPGVALHMWRRSLGADEDGGTHVRFFQAPEASDLERLPDQSVFVLRAVLQLGAATAEDIARATMLNHADIIDALRYAKARTYVTEEGGRYRVTWTWLRAISLFLQRRHLLVTP